MKGFKAKAAIALAAVLTASTLLSACGGGSDGGSDGAGGSSGDGSTNTAGLSTDFTFLTSSSFTGTNWIDEYNDNPAVKYWLDMEWDADGDGEGTKLSVDFWSPTAGSESDYVNTLVSTGDYPDVMSMSFSSETVMDLYEQGIALDLTDYVEQYMPNYLAYMESHEGYDRKMTNTVDGERRFLQLFAVNDSQGDPWGGLMYRRDWLVKYGTNPETGAAFTGAWEGDNWVDDVVFPSGNTDPVYISDWEWMLGIFQTALADMGITDGYAVQLPYTGAEGTGDLMSGFGGIGPLWYYSSDNTVDYGTTSDGMRAYIECMSTWYNNGWVNSNFAENASDMFFMVDAASVFSGKVGAWYGMFANLMNGLDTGSGDAADPLNGAVVFAAASPINDVYGDASVQNVEPTVFYTDAMLIGSYIITDKAKDKDIATLLTALDYLYSDEGSLLYAFGFSDTQMAELQDPQYLEWGLENGAYSLKEDADGGVVVVKDPMIVNDVDSLSEASSMRRTMGMDRKDIDQGFSDTMKYNMGVWLTYENTGTIQNDLINQLSADEATAYNVGVMNLMTAMAVWIPQFIDGTLDVTNDSDWQQYCDEVNAYDPESIRVSLENVLNSGE